MPAMRNCKTYGYFYSGSHETKRVEVSDHVIIGGDKAHVTGIGRKYVEVLFYMGQTTRGRLKVDPFSESVVWPGTQHQ